MTRIEQGKLSQSEITELSNILWSGMKTIEDENKKIEIENIIFRKFLIGVEEAGMRNEEKEDINNLLSRL